MTMPRGALVLGCRDCRTLDAEQTGAQRLHCACCPVVRRLVARGALATADRLMGAPGCATALAGNGSEER